MASWLSGFVDARCKILWQTFSRGLLKHFSLDIFVEYDKVALTILCGFSHVSALTFPFFRDQRCGSGTFCHVSTLQMSSYGILSILFPWWGPCGETQKQRKGIRRVREFFHQEKRTEVLFSLSKNISEWKPISTWSFVFSTPGDRLLLRTFKLSLVWSDFSIAKTGPWNKLDSGVKIMKWKLVYTVRWCSTNH